MAVKPDNKAPKDLKAAAKEVSAKSGAANSQTANAAVTRRRKLPAAHKMM